MKSKKLEKKVLAISNPVVAYAGEDVTICRGDKIILVASGEDSFIWATGETSSKITVAPSESTIYSVKVTKGEYSDTAYVKVTVDGSCSENSEKSIMIYPNPSSDLLNLDLVGYKGKTNMSLYDINGNNVYSESINSGNNSITKKQIDLSKFSKGIYFIRANNEGTTETKKVVID